jgi:tetratricopeptide (TPR) repeat protein
MFGFRRKPAPAAAPGAAEWRARGNAALAAGHLEEAGRCYAQGVQAAPADASLHLNLGFVLLEQGQVSAALHPLAQSLAMHRESDTFAHEAHFLLGRCHRLLGQHVQALSSFSDALALQPDFTPPMQEATALLQELGRPEEALAMVEAAVAADPGNVEVLQTRASLLLVLGRPARALEDFECALVQGAASAALRAGQAEALRASGRPDEALAAADASLALDFVHRPAWTIRAATLFDLRRLAEAEATLSRALALFPGDADLHWQRAIARLLQGNLAAGWPDYAFRWDTPTSGLKPPRPDYGLPRWTGAENLAGRSILVLAEQGLGDVLQCARYIPLLQEAGARVVFHVPAVMHSLLRDALPGCELISEGSVGRPDFQCLLMSLPEVFGTTVESLPGRFPYLRSDARLRAEWAQRLGDGPGLRVGVVWSGGMLFGNDANRSIHLAQFRGIETPGVQFVSLQKELRDRDRAALASWPGLLHFGEDLRSFADTAALAELMDIVVSVDTSVAHLAGGLGRPLWVLLPRDPDWRWMVDRDDSPWYPSARLFRQPARGDWNSVLERARDELRALVDTRAP